MEQHDVPWSRVPLKFQISDWTVFTALPALQVRTQRIFRNAAPVSEPALPGEVLAPGSEGFVFRSLPILQPLPAIRMVGRFVRYVPVQYRHCYIDLRWPYERYVGKFSAKTRSTIQRKIKKFTKHCGGELRWRTYRTPEEMKAFWEAAREVSSRSYQERLLGAGIPDSSRFLDTMQALAKDDRVRAWLLFDGGRPVSYLYCPSADGVLNYAYLGYDPDYMSLSVGTVLQWLALEQLFEERRFEFFDFTEGDSDHKRLFATDDVLCANVFFFRRSLRNLALVGAHLLCDRLSSALGRAAGRLKLKTAIRQFIRFRLQRGR